MIEKCERLMTFNIIQAHILRRHLKNHKWFTHLPDENQALIDFVQKFGFAMREVYCECCVYHNNCIIERDVFHIKEDKNEMQISRSLPVS